MNEPYLRRRLATVNKVPVLQAGACIQNHGMSRSGMTLAGLGDLYTY